MGQLDHKTLDAACTYHPPSEEQRAKYEAIRAAERAFLLAILDHVPGCADRSSALRLVRQAAREANTAIALEGLI